MKVALVNPPKTHQVWAGVPDIFNGKDIYLFPPMGIMYLSAAVKKWAPQHKVVLFDAQPFNWTAEQTAEAVAEEKPDLVGITAQTHDVYDVKKVLEGVRKRLPNAHIMLGGALCWSFPEIAIGYPEVNSVLKGDGEYALPEWLNALEKKAGYADVKGVYWKDEKGKVIENEIRHISQEMDELPFPDRDSLPREHYYTPGMKAAKTTTMITSRGCPYRCNFCNTYKRYSIRSAKSIVDEMEFCQKKYGIEEIHFIDDLFNRTAERVIEVANEILKRGLKMKWGIKATCRESTREMLELAKKAGMVKIHYGVETGTDEGLKALNKSLTVKEIKEVFHTTHEVGIRTIAYMMIGLPHEKTPEDIIRSARFIKDEVDPDYVVYALLSPYPDTRLFTEGAEKGLYDKDCWLNYMKNPVKDYDLPTAWTEHMSKEKLVELFKFVHRDFYFSPKKVFRTVQSITTYEELKRIVRGGLSLIKMEGLKGQAIRRL